MLQVRDLARPPMLKPASFTLPEGTCGVIMGASGSGKSLLARAIVDLDPNEGTVRWRDHVREATPAPHWRRLVAYVPAETGWWAADVATHFPADAPARAHMEDWITTLGLKPDILARQVSHLSTGERQRLALVRALIMAPEMLILDEPTGALDAASRNRVETLMRELLNEGRTLLLITHDAAQARRLGQHFWRLEAGRLTPSSPPEPEPANHAEPPA